MRGDDPLAEARYRMYNASDKLLRLMKATRWSEAERLKAIDAVAVDLRAALKFIESAMRAPRC